MCKTYVGATDWPEQVLHLSLRAHYKELQPKSNHEKNEENPTPHPQVTTTLGTTAIWPSQGG